MAVVGRQFSPSARCAALRPSAERKRLAAKQSPIAVGGGAVGERSLVGSGDDGEDHAGGDGGHDVVAVDLTPLVSGAGASEVVLVVVDALAAVPVLIAHVVAATPFLMADVLIALTVIVLPVLALILPLVVALVLALIVALVLPLVLAVVVVVVILLCEGGHGGGADERKDESGKGFLHNELNLTLCDARLVGAVVSRADFDFLGRVGGGYDEGAMPPTLFFSYSHVDEDLRMELEKQLSSMKRQGLISSWHDRRITAGEHIADTIDKNLTTAEIVLLLVSPDFIASDYCYQWEMHVALERHARGETRIIPVILRPCDWHGLAFWATTSNSARRKGYYTLVEPRRCVLGRCDFDKGCTCSGVPATRCSGA